MDNIFGKEDSGDESEHNIEHDIEGKNDKNSPSRISGSKDNEAMDVDCVQVKVYILLKKLNLFL